MKTQKGITLIALIITIIVMLILVGVSVSVALNTGLFKTAQGAAKNTEAERVNEIAISNGTINIEGQEGEISIDDYVASLKGEEGGEKVAIIPKKENYTVGEAVTIGSEAFYVIADDDDKVTLLAKDNITTTGTLEQSASAPTVAFCSADAWNAANITGENDNLNDKPSIKSETTSAVAKAIAYGESLGGTGRLLLDTDTVLFNTDSYGDILFGWNGKSSGTELSFWSGYAANTECALIFDGVGMCEAASYLDSDYYGVRPVVEILKSSIN